MTPDLIFSIANPFVMIGWVALVVAPGWKYTRGGVVLVVVLLQALLYTAVIAYAISMPDREGGGFGSLQGVAILFENPWALLAGWVHYLCFDLFVGSHLVSDARKHGVHHAIVIVCLVPTLLFGPAGLLLYNLAKFAFKRAPYEMNGAAV